LKYEPKNVEALKLVAQAAQPFPEDSVQINAYAMHRGSVSWTSPLNEVVALPVCLSYSAELFKILSYIYRVKLILASTIK